MNLSVRLIHRWNMPQLYHITGFNGTVETERTGVGAPRIFLGLEEHGLWYNSEHGKKHRDSLALFTAVYSVDGADVHASGNCGIVCDTFFGNAFRRNRVLGSSPQGQSIQCNGIRPRQSMHFLNGWSRDRPYRLCALDMASGLAL